VVVVGNKVDLRPGDAQSIDKDLRSAAAPIMEIFKQVETCIECSAKKMINIPEVMVFACKAVLHPSAPLYANKSHSLQPLCAKALRRIFELCDEDQDQVLSDTELNNFQRRCFGSSLLSHQIRGIKDVIRRNVPDGVTERGVALPGFLYLHMLFILRGRAETTWAVLRAFGYGKDLRLEKRCLPDLDEYYTDQSFELSDEAVAFVVALFHQRDLDKDGALSPDELAALFERAPSILWATHPRRVQLDANGNLTLPGYLAHWTASCYLAPRDTLECLIYLGYQGGGRESVASALWVSPRRGVEFKKQKPARSVFNVLVCCGPGVDTGASCAAFLTGTFSPTPKGEGEGGEEQAPEVAVSIASASSSSASHGRGSGERDGKKSGAGMYFLVQGVSCSAARDLLPAAGHVAHKASVGTSRPPYDAILFIYDAHNPTSFASCAEVMSEIAARKLLLPYLLASIHRDSETQAEQIVDGAVVNVTAYCSEHRLLAPTSLSTSGGLASLDALTHQLSSCCTSPHQASPALAAHLRQTAYLSSAATYGMWAVLLAGAGVFAVLRVRARK